MYTSYCFVTDSKKSLSSIASIKLDDDTSLLFCTCVLPMSAVLDCLEFAIFFGLNMVCCRVTPSHRAAKNGARSSSEKMAVMVSWGSPDFIVMGLTFSTYAKL